MEKKERSLFRKFVNWYIHNYSNDTLLLKSEVDEYNYDKILTAKKEEAKRINEIRDQQEQRLKDELDREYMSLLNEAEARYSMMKEDFNRLNEKKDFIEKTGYEIREKTKELLRIENEVYRRMEEFSLIASTLTGGFKKLEENTTKLIENK